MARAKHFSNFERTVIRTGIQAGLFPTAIANYLGRTRVGVHKQIERMKDDGSIDNQVLPMIAEEILAEIKNAQGL